MGIVLKTRKSLILWPCGHRVKLLGGALWPKVHRHLLFGSKRFIYSNLTLMLKGLWDPNGQSVIRHTLSV